MRASLTDENRLAMELGGQIHMEFLRGRRPGPRRAKALLFGTPQVKELINTHDDTSQYTERSSIKSRLYYLVFINLPLPAGYGVQRAVGRLVSRFETEIEFDRYLQHEQWMKVFAKLFYRNEDSVRGLRLEKSGGASILVPTGV